jgi:hypothetical protein
MQSSALSHFVFFIGSAAQIAGDFFGAIGDALMSELPLKMAMGKSPSGMDSPDPSPR